jgi:hypothetical protein
MDFKKLSFREKEVEEEEEEEVVTRQQKKKTTSLQREIAKVSERTKN